MDNKMRRYLLYIIGVVVFILAIWNDPSAKNLFDNHCVEVNGKAHIYSWQCLNSTYSPTQLVKLQDRDNYLSWPHELSSPAAESVHKLISDAEKDGMCLVVMGGYRSAKLQKEMYNDTALDKKEGVAKPYRSEHQTGLAVDFTACPMKDGIRDDSAERTELKNDFDTLPEYEWLVLHAKDYGFEQSFTKGNQWLTGYPYEPWHWKFIIK